MMSTTCRAWINRLNNWPFACISRGFTNILPHTKDRWNGIRMDDFSELPTDKHEFESRLTHSLNEWSINRNPSCWIKLPKPLFCHLSFCVSLGFEIHHAKPEYIMLQKWLICNEKSMIPPYAYSYVGAHAVILNNMHQMVVVEEHERPIWKIPGGAVDFGEHASDAAIREAKEETGLDTEFMGILAVRHRLHFQFDETCDVSFICLLKPMDLNQSLNPIHCNEVKDIQWMDIDTWINTGEDVFLGKDKNTLNLLNSASNWIQTYWNDTESDGAKLNNPCTQKYKQIHPFDKDVDIALYH